MSSKKDKGSAEQGIQQAGQGITQASQMTAPESQQYQSSFDIGKILNQIMQYQLGTGQAPSGYMTPEQQYQQQGPLAQSYYGQTLAGSQDPYAAFQSTLQPQLQLTQDYINRQMLGRGFSPNVAQGQGFPETGKTGMGIEQMGRAGVELAIQEAQNRMNFRNQELARAGQLSQYTQGVGQQNISNLANLYGQQQSYGQQAMGRQASGAAAAAPYYAAPFTAQLGSYYGSQGNVGAGIGGTVGAIGGGAMGAMTGNPLFALYGAGIGGAAGSQLGRAF